MRRIFIIYWIWYVATLLILISDLSFPLWFAKIFAISMFLNFVFIAYAPIYHLIYFKRSHSSDQRFLNACLSSGVIRSVIWIGAFYGLTDHKIILALNAFGMLIFLLIESKIKSISSEYFKL